MNLNTKPSMLSESLATAGIHAQYNQHAVNILSFKAVAANIMKYGLKEFRYYDQDYIIRECLCDVKRKVALHPGVMDGDEKLIEMNSENIIPLEGVVRFDVIYEAKIPGKDIPYYIIIYVEMQKNSSVQYPIVVRAIYYVARIISKEYGTVFTDSNYQSIQKACSIWILPEKGNGISRVEFNIAENSKEIGLKESDIDKEEIIVTGMGPDDEPNLGDFLYTLFSQDLTIEQKKEKLRIRYKMIMEKEMEEEELKMLSLSMTLANKYENIGFEKGINVAKQMCIDMYKDNVPVSTIARYARVSIEQVKQWIEDGEKENRG